jgi:hypothetical protein
MFCARGPMKTSARIRKIFSNGRPGARREEGTPELVPMPRRLLCHPRLQCSANRRPRQISSVIRSSSSPAFTTRVTPYDASGKSRFKRPHRRRASEAGDPRLLELLFLARMANGSLRLGRGGERAAQRIVHASLGFLVAELLVPVWHFHTGSIA